MTAIAFSAALAKMHEERMPVVDRNADGIAESLQVAFGEESYAQLVAMLTAILDPNPVATTPVYPVWVPKLAAANATTTIGASGGIGDILGGIQPIPLATTSHDISIKDGSRTAVLVYKGKITAEIKDIQPITFGPNGLPSESGAWQVISAGAGSQAMVWGKFSDTALPALVDTYIGSEGLSTSTAANTFTTVSIGSPDARRRVVIAATSSGGVDCTHSSLTATLYDNAGSPSGTVTFTKVPNSEISTAGGVAGSPNISHWQALVQTGTQIGSPILTCSAAPARVGLSYYTHGRGAALGTTPIIQASGSANSLTGTINIAEGGLLIGHSVTNTAGNLAGHTWTGLNSTFNGLQMVSTTTYSGGMYTGSVEVGRTITSDYLVNPSTALRMSVIAFGAVV